MAFHYSRINITDQQRSTGGNQAMVMVCISFDVHTKVAVSLHNWCYDIPVDFLLK